MLEAMPLPAEDPSSAVVSPPPMTGTLEAPAPAPTPEPRRATPGPGEAAPRGAAEGTPPPRDNAFAEEMSAGLAALEGGEFAAAKAAFERARALDAASASGRDGLARAEAGLRREAVSGELRAAADLEGREAWAAAEARYRKVLTLDGALSDALRGLERSSRRARLDQRLEGYLAHPRRLTAQGVLEEAAVTLEEAREIPTPGPRLRAQQRRLAALIESSSTAVRVLLSSDGETQVTVYQVGSLGTFSRQELELRPGSYTVVGSRKGYRDVRRTLVVEAGREPPVFEIRCEEKV